MAIFTTTVRARTARGKEIMLSVGGINGVATLPEFRRRGFGGKLLLDCHAKMRANGCDIALLTTDIDNWYRRFGWERGAQRWTFTIDRGAHHYLPQLEDSLLVEEATMTTSALADVSHLHRAEPLGAQRRSELDSLLLNRLGNRLFVVRHTDRFLAYVVVRGDQILEHGGPSEVTAGLIRTIFEEADDCDLSTSGRDENDATSTLRMTIHTPPVHDGLSHLLDELGMPFNRTYLGMIYVVNPQQLMHKITPHLTIEETTEEQILIHNRTDQLRIGRREMVKLLFGPERISSFMKEGVPVSFYQWSLDWV